MQTPGASPRARFRAALRSVTPRVSLCMLCMCVGVRRVSPCLHRSHWQRTCVFDSCSSSWQLWVGSLLSVGLGDGNNRAYVELFFSALSLLCTCISLSTGSRWQRTCVFDSCSSSSWELWVGSLLSVGLGDGDNRAYVELSFSALSPFCVRLSPCLHCSHWQRTCVFDSCSSSSWELWVGSFCLWDSATGTTVCT